mgnify:CR=1 FL=1
MFKVKFLNIILFLLIKYSVFFFVIAFIDNRFKNAVLDNASSTLEVVKLTMNYILYVLFYSTFLIALFCVPLYFVLRIKKGILFLLGAITFLAVEFLVYTYLASETDLTLGTYNAIIGVVLLFILFYTPIRQKFVKQ